MVLVIPAKPKVGPLTENQILKYRVEFKSLVYKILRCLMLLEKWLYYFNYSYYFIKITLVKVIITCNYKENQYVFVLLSCACSVQLQKQG